MTHPPALLKTLVFACAVARASAFAKLPSETADSSLDALVAAMSAEVDFDIGAAPHPDQITSCAEVANHKACLGPVKRTCEYSCTGSGADDESQLKADVDLMKEGLHNATASYDGAERDAIEAIALQRLWRTWHNIENEPVSSREARSSSASTADPLAYMDLQCVAHRPAAPPRSRRTPRTPHAARPPPQVRDQGSELACHHRPRMWGAIPLFRSPNLPPGTPTVPVSPSPETKRWGRS